MKKPGLLEKLIVAYAVFVIVLLGLAGCLSLLLAPPSLPQAQEAVQVAQLQPPSLPGTAAARFVLRHGLGRVAPYRSQAFAEAVEALCRPEEQARCRAAAARLAPALSAEGMAEWIWRSLEAGGPADGRFRPLEAGA